MPFLELLHFTLDTYLVLLSVKHEGIKYHFKVFCMTRPGIKTRSPGPLRNTLPMRTMTRSSKLKLAIVVENDPKAPVSIATTPRSRGGRYSFPWIAPLYPWYVPVRWVLSKEVSSTIFKPLVWLNLGLNPGLPHHWRTLYPLGWTTLRLYLECLYLECFRLYLKTFHKSDFSTSVQTKLHFYVVPEYFQTDY